MVYIYLIALLVSHIVIMKAIKNKIVKKKIHKVFKIKVIMAPLSVVLSLLLIKVIELPLTEAGLTLGRTGAGLKSVLYIGLPLALISSALVFTTPKEELDQVKYGNQKDIWTFIYVWILVGPVEELLYRGFVQGTLSTLIKGKLFYFSYATIIASVIFVLAHVTNVYTKNESWRSFFSMVPTRFIAAMVLGFSFQVSDSLLYPIIIHNLIDGFNLSVLTYRKQELKNENLDNYKEED